MHYIGIDLHKLTIVYAVCGERGRASKAVTLQCDDADGITKTFSKLRPFRAVIEASGTYRWLYEKLRPFGEVILAHPLRLRAIVSGRAKTDKLDAALLATLNRHNLIPTSYIPPDRYQWLRDLTRARTRLARRQTEAKNELRALLNRTNTQMPYRNPFGKRGSRHVLGLDFGIVGNITRDEIYRRLEHYERELTHLDESLSLMAESFPESAALTELYGVGLFTALLVIGELGEPWRFSDARKVGAYAGLTARVNQSGGHCYHGNITRQGPSLLRWVLVEAAMKITRRDRALHNFYERIRKRSGAKVARVAVARKLAGICWLRLMSWHRRQATA